MNTALSLSTPPTRSSTAAPVIAAARCGRIPSVQPLGGGASGLLAVCRHSW